MKLTVKVDKTLCIGSANCIERDPEHFELNAEGKAQVKKSKNDAATYEVEVEVDLEGKERLLRAARVCPTQAISIADELGNQIFP